MCRCTDERLSSSEQIQACLPLHSNLIHLYRTLDRYRSSTVSLGQVFWMLRFYWRGWRCCRCPEASVLCERLLEVCPLYCPLLEITAELHLSSGHADQAEELWRRAHSDSACSARIVLQRSKSLLSQVREAHHLRNIVQMARRSLVCFCCAGQARWCRRALWQFHALLLWTWSRSAEVSGCVTVTTTPSSHWGCQNGWKTKFEFCTFLFLKGNISVRGGGGGGGFCLLSWGHKRAHRAKYY